MKRVKNNQSWSLFCPTEAPHLIDSYGKKFEKLYTNYEEEGKARKTVKARELWNAILKAQIETGTPYMLYKDAYHKKYYSIKSWHYHTYNAKMKYVIRGSKIFLHQ